MEIIRTPRYLVPVVFIMLAALLVGSTGGAASAQESNGDDFGIWYTQGRARQRGGFLDASGLAASGRIDPCTQGPNQTCEDRDGFLIYFGNFAGGRMDASYTVHVDSSVPDLVITVGTYYDSRHIEEYAEFLYTDVREFAELVGLNPVCNALQSDFPFKVCHNVSTVPIGRGIATSSVGSNSVTFTPVPGDIGAYLIIIRSDNIYASGDYSIAVTMNS